MFVAGSFALPLAAYAAIPFFGPIIPTAYNTCAASWGLLITVVNNIISFLITIAIVFVAPLMIAYAGFLLVVNPVNAGGKEKAKSILLNTVVGIVIAMAGWLIVDAVMAVLYNPTAVGKTWSQLIGSGGIPPCIPLAGSLTSAAGQPPVTGVRATGPLSTPPSGTPGTACDPAVIQQAVPNLDPNKVNALACLAGPESTCGSTMKNYSWDKDTGNGKASTAYGAFQVTLSGNHAAFENQACRDVAGVSGPLNCQRGFDPNGFTAGGNSTVLAYCMKAAANINCNAAAAAYVLGKQGFSAWTGDPRGAVKQRQCILQYAGL